MTNAPQSRKTHITRILGTNKAGERLDDVWVDVERMDVIKSSTQVPPDLQWQGVQRKLRWHDDPDGADEYFREGTPSRLTEVLKVCDPQSQDVNDPDEWVPVRVIKAMRSKGSAESMGQGFADRFVNSVNADDLNSSRVIQSRKISHYDTNIDDDAKAAFDADPERTEFVVKGENYVKDFTTKDDQQFVEHEIVTYLKHQGNNSQIAGLGRQTKLLNQHLIDDSDAAAFETVGASGFNPPYRLDPFQNIVNVSWGGLAVEFGDGAL